MGSAQSFLSFLIPFVVFFISQPSLSACDCVYRSIFVSNTGKHMGSYQMPPRRNALIPLSILSIFFMSAPHILDRSRFLSTGRASGCRREAHRVGPVLLVGLHVLCFLLHDHTSLNGYAGPGISDQYPYGGSGGIRPHPVDPFAHQVDPGVVVNPVCAVFWIRVIMVCPFR